MATYTVKKGDTLSEIAAANNTSVANLVKLNDITNPNYIVVGQVLQLSGSTTTKKKNTTSKPTIKAFGVQSNTENTMYATWKWDKSNTKEYRVLWHYATGDGVWFVGSDSTVTVKQATYSPPSNATKVKFKVKAVSKTRKVNGKDTAYWTSQWSTEKTYTFDLDDPEKPSVPSVSIDKYKLTAEIDTYDKYTHYVYFQVVKDDKTLFKTGMAKVTKNHASWSCTVTAGHEYKVRCQGARSYKSGSWTKYDYGEYSEYSANVSTIPAASKGIITLKTQSETSVLIDWHNVSNATSYEIQYTTKKGYFDSSNEVSSMTVDSVVGHAEVTGLESGNEYFFRVRAVNDQGESAWTEIKSVIVGKKPAVPTTWSSTTTGIVGEDIALYWAHNSEDASDQHGVAMELNIGGSITNIILYTESGTNSVDVDETTTYTFYGIKLDTENELDIGDITITVTLKEANGVCVIPTDTYSEGTNIKWRVKTKGILAEFSDWSIERTIDIYAPPTLELNVTNSVGTALETIESFPFYVSGVAGPDTQKVIGYHISVIADEGYVTEDQIGNEQTISPGQEVYSNYFDISEDLLLELTPSSLDLENNISYTVNGTVSMDSGLTAEASTSFTVSWTDLEYEPNAEINIDRETLTASIRPYCGEEGYSVDGLEWIVGTGMGTGDTSNIKDVAYGDGKFVAVDNVGNIYYSEDNGATWINNGVICDSGLNAIVYGDGKFVVVGNAGKSYHSEDGITWTAGTNDSTYAMTDIAYGDGKFVAISNDVKSYYSEDGITWTACNSIDFIFRKVTYGNGKFVAVGNDSNAGYKWVNGTSTYVQPDYLTCYSEDGITWIAGEGTDMPDNGLINGAFTNIVYNNDKFITIKINGYSSAEIWYSADGITWELASSYDAADLTNNCNIAYGGNYFIAVQGTSIYYSEDGFSWTLAWESVSEKDFTSVTYGNETFVSVGGIKTKYVSGTGYTLDGDSGAYYLKLVSSLPDTSLSVYRREFDGTFVELMTGIQNGSNTWVPDPHPALDYARYRIVAIDNFTGSVSYCDLPGYPVGEKAVIIQWNEEWSYFDVTNEDEMEKPPWEGSMLKLPYNIDVADKYDTDVSLVGYIGRRNPVSYYGTQIGETASWKVDIDKKDEETLYALRRLAIWMGDVYVREPSGSGYWAHIKVSFSQTHCELTIPVTLDITRVEGGI